MEIDRKLQLEILTYLKTRYPNKLGIDDWNQLSEMAPLDHLVANMLYLEEHALMISGIERGRKKHRVSTAPIRITAKGLDFIEADGGLGAILNILTVKIHGDTLDKVEALIAQSSLSQKDKAGLIAQLKSLPVYAIERLTHGLVDLGLEQTKAALPLIQKYVANTLADYGICPSP